MNILEIDKPKAFTKPSVMKRTWQLKFRLKIYEACFLKPYATDRSNTNFESVLQADQYRNKAILGVIKFVKEAPTRKDTDSSI